MPPLRWAIQRETSPEVFEHFKAGETHLRRPTLVEEVTGGVHEFLIAEALRTSNTSWGRGVKQIAVVGLAGGDVAVWCLLAPDRGRGGWGAKRFGGDKMIAPIRVSRHEVGMREVARRGKL